MDPDLVVIGGGAAGIGAARAARSKGASVVMVEKARIGGDCTFTGCVPSKAVIEAAEHDAGFSEAMAHARRAVEEVAATESAEVLRHEGVEVVEGEARFVGRNTLELAGKTVRASRVVIATGAHPAVPPIPGLESIPYLTNETLFDLSSPPSSLAVLGGGPIGAEMAQAFSRLGSDVTIVEARTGCSPGTSHWLRRSWRRCSPRPGSQSAPDRRCEWWNDATAWKG